MTEIMNNKANVRLVLAESNIIQLSNLYVQEYKLAAIAVQASSSTMADLPFTLQSCGSVSIIPHILPNRLLVKALYLTVSL